jgi:hypothetical protein
MDWLIPAIIGWCGTYWRPRIPGGGGGGGDPDPWPPNCWVCGGIIGALSAIVINMIAGPAMADAGFFGHALVSFAAGFVGNQIVGGAVGMMRGK